MSAHTEYPPPYSAHPQQPRVVITTVPGTILVNQSVGPDPTHTTCQSCHQEMRTRVERTPTLRTHLIAAVLCVFVCWPCVCVPYCMDSCLNTDHYCSNCGAFVGTYIR